MLLTALPPQVFPSLPVELLGVIAQGGDPPECPQCGGYLDCCQPDSDLDDDAQQLVGVCADCGRLSLVSSDGALTVVMILPTARELGAQAWAVSRS